MALLKYAPPALSNPTIVNLDANTFYGPTFADNEDVLINMPGVLRTNQINIVGGRNIRIIGGAYRQPSSVDGPTGIRIGNCTGSVFIEGLNVDMNQTTGDAINAGGSGASPWTNRADVYLQNCYIHGLIGTEDTNHSDGYQPQYALHNLYVDKVTIEAGLQGMFLPAQKPINSAFLSRLNFRYPSNWALGHQIWFDGSGSGTGPFGLPNFNPYPTMLDQVYTDPGTSGRDFLRDLIWPQPGEVGGSSLDPIGALTDDGGLTAYWPAINQITGVVTKGPPPGGDFADSTAGIGYVSPGYVSNVTPGSTVGLGGRQQISRCL